jgi:hypothetical protein
MICTGYSNQISKEKAEAMGIKVFAYKPLVKKELAETVRNVLDDWLWHAGSIHNCPGLPACDPGQYSP